MSQAYPLDPATVPCMAAKFEALDLIVVCAPRTWDCVCDYAKYAWHARLRREARRLVTLYAPLIQEVADVLLERETLSAMDLLLLVGTSEELASAYGIGRCP